MSGGRARRRADDGLSQQPQPGCTSPPSWRRSNRRGATLRRSLRKSATAPPRAIFGGRERRRKSLGAERRQAPLLAQSRRIQLHGSWMGPEAAPAAATWRLWGSKVRPWRCALGHLSVRDEPGGSSVESQTKASAGSQGLARAPGAWRSLAEHFCRLAHDQVVVQPSRFILPESGERGA